MSSRTLSRRLAAQGESFGLILDKLRSNLAARYLRRNDLSLSQIGWLLGYSESSSFVRAVQRWTGKAPGEVRRALAQDDITNSDSEL
jgi:AraC-like DNA-binding protein